MEYNIYCKINLYTLYGRRKPIIYYIDWLTKIMKKFIMMAAVVGVMSLSLFGCGSTDNGATDSDVNVEETTEAGAEEETLEEETSEEETAAEDEAGAEEETEAGAEGETEAAN